MQSLRSVCPKTAFWQVFFMLAFLPSLAFGGDGNPIDADERSRARSVRNALLAVLESFHGAGRVWPSAPRQEDRQLDLEYLKPQSLHSVEINGEVAATTVVLHERFDRHPSGVWLGYFDGHLEFVQTAEALKNCKRQADIIRDAIAVYGHPFDSDLAEKVPAERLPSPQLTLQSATVRLRVVDAAGIPIEGAKLGRIAQFGTPFGTEEGVGFYGDGWSPPAVSDKDGRASISVAQLFGRRLAMDTKTAKSTLYILHESRQLVAQIVISKAQFAAADEIQATAVPACRVTCYMTSMASAELQEGLRDNSLFVFWPGQGRLRAVSAASSGSLATFYLPPGCYGICVDSAETYAVNKYIEISPRDRELNFFVALSPKRTTLLVGHASPELGQMAAWVGNRATSVAAQRGKVVLLDFWGTWCGPCVAAMPELFKLHDALSANGLVIIAIHDNSVRSVDEMDQKAERARKELWGGRRLPFFVAIDGGSEVRIKDTSILTRGSTTAAFGITSFPTTLVIDRSGKIVRNIDVRDAEDRKWLQAFVQSTYAAESQRQGLQTGSGAVSR